MKNILVAAGLVVLACIVTMLWATGCYRCDGPNCSNIPSDIQPDYPASSEVVETFADDSTQALSSPCGKACENFRKLGCPEGTTSSSGLTCYRACVRMVSVRRVPAACWVKADSIEHLRGCGPDIRCVP